MKVNNGYHDFPYKGWYYKFEEENNIWKISDRKDEMDMLFIFNSDYYRLDQCFEKIQKEMKDKKYFIPTIEDIRVGYECERFTQTSINGEYDSKDTEPCIIEESWKKYIFKPMSFSYKNVEVRKEIKDVMFLNNLKLRTLYLTKEQIEAEGWKKSDYSFIIADLTDEQLHGDRYSYLFSKNYNSLVFNEYSKEIRISNKKKRILYSGECKDINELRFIQKLLKIN